jgi:hypothetical protein
MGVTGPFLALDSEPNLRFAKYQTDNCFYSEELKDILEVEMANALNGALSELKAQKAGALSPTAADAIVLLSACEKVSGKLGEHSRKFLEKQNNDVLILTKWDKETGPGWQASVQVPQKFLVLKRQCGLFTDPVGVALIMLSRVHDGSRVVDGMMCECEGCLGTADVNDAPPAKKAKKSPPHKKLVLVAKQKSKKP